MHSLVGRLLKTVAYSEAAASVPSAASAAGGGGEQAKTVVVNSPRLRAAALRCLYLLAQRPVADAPSVATAGKLSPLLPEKGLVLRSLRLALDDPKRDVRKAAVDARGAWLRGVEDAPEEDE